MFDRITAQLEVWPPKSFCKWKELELLIGHLQQACKVAPQAQSFSHCMTNVLCAISTMSFSLTMAGGRNFSNFGMVVVFFGIHNGSLCPTSKFHLMPLGYCVMVPFFSITGSQLHGSKHRSPSQFNTMNFSLLWRQPTIIGVHGGPLNGSTFYQTTPQW